MFLEERKVFIRREAEGDGIGSTPSDDVARGLNTRAGFFAARDPIANAGERNEHATAIADRGDAVFELDLRCFENDIFLAGVVADEGLVAIFHAAIKGEVNVGIDDAGDNPFAGDVDDLGAGGYLDGGARADGLDARAFNDMTESGSGGPPFPSMTVAPVMAMVWAAADRQHVKYVATFHIERSSSFQESVAE